MPVSIISASGVQYGMKVNSDGSINVTGGGGGGGSSGAPIGYSGNQIIRLAAGSPASYYIFSALSQSIMIDNLGSNSIYFNLQGVADPTSSGTGYIDQYSFRAFDAQVGSISIQGSGTTTPLVQIVRLS